MTRIIFLTITILFSTLALITQGFISYSNPLVAKAVNQYGAVVSQLAPLEVVYPGTIRGEILTPDDMVQVLNGTWVSLSWRELHDFKREAKAFTVVAVTPDASRYSQVISSCLANEIKVVVESSGMDAWHSTAEGLNGLRNLTSKALRVVIFDGGHHLPTLGLQPDLLIVPVTMGYAAHGHTRDAVRLEELLTVLKREQINCPVVAVPRWGLVKTPASMNRVAVEALAQLPVGKTVPRNESQILGSRFTGYGPASFLYVNRIPDLNRKWLESVSQERIKRVYVAFNYDVVNQHQSKEFLESLKRAGLQVMLVNEPLQVAGVILRGGM